MGRIKFFGAKRLRLGRTAKQSRHLLRTMITQLIEHERIRTTLGKARALRPLAERVVAFQKRANVVQQKKAQNVLTTDYARQKLRMELVPRLKERNGHVTRIVEIGKRRGDKAQMAYIEYIDNELDKYEQGVQKQQKETEVDKKEWEKKICTQEKEYYAQKIADAEAKIIQIEQSATPSEANTNELNQLRKLKEVLKKNITRVEHDLFILNKDKYDLIKFTHIY